MVLRIATIFLCLLVYGQPSAYETEALISLRQDFSGLGAHTWELVLKQDGSVVEEQYDIYAKGPGQIETSKRIRSISPEQAQQLASQAAKLIEGMPTDIEERIVVDPETKAIRIKSGGRKLFAGWSLYESTPPSNATRAFQEAWIVIEKLLRGPSSA
jgi:hypothetical protein